MLSFRLMKSHVEHMLLSESLNLADIKGFIMRMKTMAPELREALTYSVESVIVLLFSVFGG